MAKKRSGSSPRGRRADRNAAYPQPPDKDIDFSDLPELSLEQLQSMKRVGRPRLGQDLRAPISLRLDPRVVVRFRREASRRKMGYQSLMHEVLAKHVKLAG